jgi:hypothetical protein
MNPAAELMKALENAFRERSFDSKDSLIRLTQNGNYIFQWKSENINVKGEFLQEDSIGLLVNSLTVEKDIQEDKDPTQYLKHAAEAIEERVNYLLEPLKIVEFDSTSNAVQMRSEKPEVTDGNVSYYELILKSGKWFGYRDYCLLRRYMHRTDDEPSRKIVAFPLTKRQLEKLLSDLIDIL